MIKMEDGELSTKEKFVVEFIMQYIIENNSTLHLANDIVKHVDQLKKEGGKITGKAAKKLYKKWYREALTNLLDAYLIANNRYAKIYNELEKILQETEEI